MLQAPPPLHPRTALSNHLATVTKQDSRPLVFRTVEQVVAPDSSGAPAFQCEVVLPNGLGVHRGKPVTGGIVTAEESACAAVLHALGVSANQSEPKQE